jgi:hypothetical protein
MLEKSFGLLFYLKQTPSYKEDQMYIYLRITVDGLSKEISTKRLWYVSKWNARAGRADGNSEAARSVNQLLDALHVKVHDAKRIILEAGKEISAEAIKNLMLGVDDRKMILAEFQKHNDQISELVPHEYSPGTLDLFKRA